MKINYQSDDAPIRVGLMQTHFLDTWWSFIYLWWLSWPS